MTEKPSPGEAIKAALDRRRWTQADLAHVTGKTAAAVNEIIQGKRMITPEMAVALGAAIGETPEYWLELDSIYRLASVPPTPDVENRARLFSLAPVKDMERRGWIPKTEDAGELESALCKFFNVDSLGDPPRIKANARQSFATDGLSPQQTAWCIRASHLAQGMEAAKFTDSGFENCLAELRKLADYPEKARHIPKVLAQAGVRLVVNEPLPHTRIDGAAFWLADDAPVIVLSVRFDRIDSFWHTLAHECIHIKYRDAQSVDSDLVGEERASSLPDFEARADQEATEFLLSPQKLRSFILRVKPFYSKIRIVQFAQVMKVHPGIVVGQLHHLHEIGWATNREMLAKVRDRISAVAVTDGWGKTISTK